ncbi:MAG: hypothetical protein ACE3JK_09715 [Sporolactobacillus sp.]
MLIDLKQLKTLFQELKKILEKEEDNETLYIINQLEISLRLIDECLNFTNKNRDLKQVFNTVKEIYTKINRPRVGLSDYFIWRENYEERVKANVPLDRIKDNLSLIFRKY